MAAARKTNPTWARTRLAALRADRGIPQAQMAHAIGVSATTYRRLERGHIDNPPLRYLVNAAIVLRVELDDVIDDKWREWLVLDPIAAPEPPDLHRVWRKRRELLGDA